MRMLDIADKMPTNRRSEDIFLAWLFGLPDSANVAEAARIEIARIDTVALPSEQVARLRTMLVQASYQSPLVSRRRRRQRH